MNTTMNKKLSFKERLCYGLGVVINMTAKAGRWPIL